ncbi:MAG: RcpC/CpaB family pilus assembly protein, partial [Anaerolineae bacterium]
RAFALPYDALTGVGGEVQDGDRVDIVASVKIESTGGQVGVGKIIGRNVLVLKASRGQEGDKGTVILALTPSQIEDIAFALTSGQIRLALNPYVTDEQAANTEGVTGRLWLEKFGFKFSEQPTGGQSRR